MSTHRAALPWVGILAVATSCGSASGNVDLSAGTQQSAAAVPPAAPQPVAAPAEPAPAAGDGVAKIEGDQIVVNQRILYDTDKDQISPESFPILDSVASILNSHPEIVSMTVEGHTDNQGAVDYNIKLSERRANAVVQYLVQRGVRQPMRAPGYGASAPVCYTNDEGCRAQNRRVVFKIKRQGE
jgi:peptidoglycan-associated lipoprotein